MRTGWFGGVLAATLVLVPTAQVQARQQVQPQQAQAQQVQAQQVQSQVQPLQAPQLSDYCGASASDLVPAVVPTVPAPAATPSGTADRPLSYRQPRQLPIGLWSAAVVTLRAPAAHGTVRLDLTSRGFSTDSVEIQRYLPATRHWVDLPGATGTTSFPTRGSFSFPVSTRADDAHPETVALRLQDLDRPGSLAVVANYADGHGHQYRAPAVHSDVTRPEVRFTGWPAKAVLTRGGPAQRFTLTVHNGTDRRYPSVTALFYAYGMGGGKALTPHDLVFRQFRPGHGWTTLPLVASSCDPGMSVPLRPSAGVALSRGATETVLLELAVSADAPHQVGRAEAGLSVQSGDTSLGSDSLPFTVKG